MLEDLYQASLAGAGAFGWMALLQIEDIWAYFDMSWLFHPKNSCFRYSSTRFKCRRCFQRQDQIGHRGGVGGFLCYDSAGGWWWPHQTYPTSTCETVLRFTIIVMSAELWPLFGYQSFNLSRWFNIDEWKALISVRIDMTFDIYSYINSAWSGMIDDKTVWAKDSKSPVCRKLMRRKAFTLLISCPIGDIYITEHSKIFRGCSKREALRGHPWWEWHWFDENLANWVWKPFESLIP